MFAPISKLAVHAIYLSALLAVPNLFVNANGKPIKLLIIVMPITEPIPKMRIKLKDRGEEVCAAFDKRLYHLL